MMAPPMDKWVVRRELLTRIGISCLDATDLPSDRRDVVVNPEQ
jgi:hypothetical protein